MCRRRVEYTARQRRAITVLERETGFEVLRKDEGLPFEELWASALYWLREWLGECISCAEQELVRGEE